MENENYQTSQKRNINDHFCFWANMEYSLEYSPARPSFRFHNHLEVSVVFQFQRVDCKQVSNFRAVAGHLGQTGTHRDLEEIEICMLVTNGWNI